jgi:hypothetical protein
MELPLNNSLPLVMHVGLNSCYAVIEQQANPLIRYKPVGVAAYTSPGEFTIVPATIAIIKRFFKFYPGNVTIVSAGSRSYDVRLHKVSNGYPHSMVTIRTSEYCYCREFS